MASKSCKKKQMREREGEKVGENDVCRTIFSFFSLSPTLKVYIFNFVLFFFRFVFFGSNQNQYSVKITNLCFLFFLFFMLFSSCFFLCHPPSSPFFASLLLPHLHRFLLHPPPIFFSSISLPVFCVIFKQKATTTKLKNFCHEAVKH